MRVNKKKKESDESLLRRFQQRDDISALSRLFKRYSHQVLALCHYYLKNKEESKDALMDIFHKVMQSQPKEDIKNFKAWLQVVIRNHCLIQLKKRKKTRAFLKEMEKIKKMDMENNRFYSLINEEKISSEMLYTALEQLSEQQKICLRLFYNDEMTYGEIKQKTGYTFNQVKSYMQNGRQRLKKLLITQEGRSK